MNTKRMTTMITSSLRGGTIEVVTIMIMVGSPTRKNRNSVIAKRKRAVTVIEPKEKKRRGSVVIKTELIGNETRWK